MSLLNRGLFADAEAYFREVLRSWPDHAGSLNNLGTAVLRQGRVQEAENYYRRARALKPNDFAILNNLGNVLWEQGRLEASSPMVIGRRSSSSPTRPRRSSTSGSRSPTWGVRRGVGLHPRVAPAPARFPRFSRQPGNDARPAREAG